LSKLLIKPRKDFKLKGDRTSRFHGEWWKGKATLEVGYNMGPFITRHKDMVGASRGCKEDEFSGKKRRSPQPGKIRWADLPFLGGRKGGRNGKRIGKKEGSSIRLSSGTKEILNGGKFNFFEQ